MAGCSRQKYQDDVVLNPVFGKFKSQFKFYPAVSVVISCVGCKCPVREGGGGTL